MGRRYFPSMGMVKMQPTQCVFCDNYLEKSTCKAFPEGIPHEFLVGELHHSKPVPGQVGKFVLKDNFARRLAERRGK